MNIGRRRFLASVAATLALPRLAYGDEPAPAFDFPLPDGAPRLIEWDLGHDRRVAILVPEGPADARWPVVVALHGRGETKKPPRDGALGWPRDYALVRAMGRVTRPPLTIDDYEGFVADDALAATNSALAERPYGGLVVVCPRIPDLKLEDEAAVQAYGSWLVGTLLPKVRRELPVLQGAASTGIDGVSLGGAMAIRIGLAHPGTFGAVGSLQPAVTKEEGPDIEARLRAARSQRKVAFRLTTSAEDFFRWAIRSVHGQLRTAKLAHDYAELLGPHDYPFNRGPGAYELLLWHDRRLAR